MKLRGKSREPVVTSLKLKPRSTALTDLFTHLSHVEYSPYMVEVLRSGEENRVMELLETYELTDEIKDLIIAYVRNPCQETVDPIKAAAANEIQNMWEELGIC